MKCLVTGGAGFIGSNLVDALLARGDEVTGGRRPLDRAAGEPRRGARGRRDAGRARHPRRRRAGASWRSQARPDVVFHLAAQIDVRKSIADPAFDASINVGGTANVLEAARGAGSRRVVFVSTGGAIYGEGEGQELPLDEDAPVEPLSAYGQSKFAAEGYLALYERLYGLSSVSAAARQRLRPAPGPARRGGRDRDLLRPAARRRAADRVRRRDARPATTYMWGTWSPRRWRRRRRRRAARSTSAPDVETDVLELARQLGELEASATSSPSSPPPAPARCSGSRSTRRGPSASWAGARGSSSKRASG